MPIIRGQLISNFDHSVNAAALSHSSVAHINNYSFFNNMGAVAHMDRSVISLNGGLLYGLPELKVFQAGAAMKISDNDVGVVSIGSFGDINYRETSIGIGYSRKLGDKLGAGFKSNYTQLRIPEFGRNNTFTFKGGIIWEFLPNFRAGYTTQYYLDSESIEFEDHFFHTLGISYQMARNTSFMLSTFYRGQWEVNAGIVYNIIDQMVIKLGVEGSDPSFSFGLGYQIAPEFGLDAAFQYHSTLGLSPFFGLIYILQTKTQS